MAATAPQAPQTDPQLAAEYELLRSSCGLVDRGHRGRLALTGSGAAEFLGGQVTNDIEALTPGKGCYAAFLTHKGKMLGDLRVLAVGDTDSPEGEVTELLLETERVALQGLFDMIRRFKIGFDVELHKRTLESTTLSLIGPTARQVAESALQPARSASQQPAGSAPQQPTESAPQQPARSASQADELLPPATEHAHLAATIAGMPVHLVATAEPDGIDIVCDAPDRDAVEQALLAAGAQPASEDAAEILRIEHGRPRYGLELDDGVIPQEANLNQRAVSFTKGCYVGQETVARLYYKGKPNRHLRGLLLSEPLPIGTELRLGERAVGQLTSSVVSPRLGPIGLALLRREAEPGATLAAGPDGASAQPLALPFEHRHG
ncbi:MAG TPA: folate-binding protein [Solirubrobacteraceae bacterium]